MAKSLGLFVQLIGNLAQTTCTVCYKEYLYQMSLFICFCKDVEANAKMTSLTALSETFYRY